MSFRFDSSGWRNVWYGDTLSFKSMLVTELFVGDRWRWKSVQKTFLPVRIPSFNVIVELRSFFFFHGQTSVSKRSIEIRSNFQTQLGFAQTLATLCNRSFFPLCSLFDASPYSISPSPSSWWLQHRHETRHRLSRQGFDLTTFSLRILREPFL